ncbi:hypothetical protein GCM10010300_74020 [Streptomyces olivaceoviridis]|nr:hypothetical protein GCM10010300_74020 [Streptomyces olivaceoviridis]
MFISGIRAYAVPSAPSTGVRWTAVGSDELIHWLSLPAAHGWASGQLLPEIGEPVIGRLGQLERGHAEARAAAPPRRRARRRRSTDRSLAVTADGRGGQRSLR